jgi:diaminopimelate epimerase
VGSDGLLVLSGADDRAFGLRIFNPDGSEAEKSGNGIRIFARWLVSSGRASASQFTIHTLGGDVPVEVAGPTVTADMGIPHFRTDLTELQLDAEPVPVVALDIGNPHCVIFRDQIDITQLRRLGPSAERHPAFPNRTNVQLARVVDRAHVELLIWERGAGETQASGSSACAVVAAAQHLGLVDQAAQITASMPGGHLDISIDRHQHIWMRGPVEETASITLSAELIARLHALR